MAELFPRQPTLKQAVGQVKKWYHQIEYMKKQNDNLNDSMSHKSSWKVYKWILNIILKMILNIVSYFAYLTIIISNHYNRCWNKHLLKICKKAISYIEIGEFFYYHMILFQSIKLKWIIENKQYQKCYKNDSKVESKVNEEY